MGVVATRFAHPLLIDATERVKPGLLVDRRQDDRAPVGIEVYDPEVVTVADVNTVLQSLCEAPLTAEEVKRLAGLG